MEAAEYIIHHIIEESRHRKHITWTKNTIKSTHCTVIRMSRYHNVDCIVRTIERKEINLRRMSQNKHNEKQKQQIRFGIKVPNNVWEALLYGRENRNTARVDAIKMNDSIGSSLSI